MIYITGDKHGKFSEVIKYYDNNIIHPDDTIIILGDSGINYYENDNRLKKMLNNLNIKMFIIHGNHENRATNIETYKQIDYYGGKALAEDKYPNLIFAIDGEIYNILDNNNNYRKCIVIGGAYSVDKYYRLNRGYDWWEDEQPSDNIKSYVEQQLSGNDYKVDYVFSHTCPYNYIPTEWFLDCVDQSTVDNSTEIWLQSIYNKIDFGKWYCGHFHGDKSIDNIRFMYNDIIKLENI